MAKLKLGVIVGTSGGVISTAVAQQHLRAVLGSGQGLHVMGGEAYIQFKPTSWMRKAQSPTRTYASS